MLFILIAPMTSVSFFDLKRFHAFNLYYRIILAFIKNRFIAFRTG